VDEPTRDALRMLLAAVPVAALGTLREGRDGPEPFVSMVPVAWAADGRSAFVHVSTLAQHTRDLQRQPRAALLFTAALQPDDDPQALPRLSLQVDARFLERGGESWAAAEAAYRARFPRSEQTFALGDFHLVALQPRTARFVAGFGRAHAVDADTLAALAAQAGQRRSTS
jgi:putative heme iron utilization protein